MDIDIPCISIYLRGLSDTCEATSLGPRIWLAHRAEFAGDLLGGWQLGLKMGYNSMDMAATSWHVIFVIVAIYPFIERKCTKTSDKYNDDGFTTLHS
jgi:hypothetical protein